MVNVSHHRNDWGSWDEIVLVVLLLADSLAHLCAHIFRIESELLSHEVDGFSVESLVD